MTTCKRLAAAAMCLLCLMMLLPVSAGAKGGFEAENPLSLTVSYVDGETPVVGAPFRLYQVAKLNDDLTLTAAPPFSDFKSSIENPDTKWDILAASLEDYVIEMNVSPDDEAKTNAVGKAHFPSGEKALTPGVYLVVSQRYRFDGKIYYPAPVIITLPNQDADGAWEYDVTAYAKFTPAEDEPIELVVIKKWSDKDNEDKRPKEITVILLKDGKEYDRVKLNPDNGWTHIWKNLDPIHEWTVKEVEVEDYETQISEPTKTDNIWTIIILNKYEPPKPPQLPQTGQLNWPIPVLLAFGTVLLTLGCFLRFGRRKDDYA